MRRRKGEQIKKIEKLKLKTKIPMRIKVYQFLVANQNEVCLQKANAIL